MSAIQTTASTDTSHSTPRCNRSISANHPADNRPAPSTVDHTRPMLARPRSAAATTTASPHQTAQAIRATTASVASGSRLFKNEVPMRAAAYAAAAAADPEAPNPASRSHSYSPIDTSSAHSPSRALADQAPAAPSTASRITAVITRWRSMAGLSRSARLGYDAAEPSLATGEPFEGGIQFAGIEIRPQYIGEVQLGVGELPKQKIADSALSAGADQQIGVGPECQRQLLRKSRLVDRRDLAFPCRLSLQAQRRLNDVPASAVAGANGQIQPLVV